MKINNKGYAVYELIVLFGILAIVYGVVITKVSFAFEEATNKENIEAEITNSIKIASKIYVQNHVDKFKKNEESYIYGKDLTEKGYLIETDDFDYASVKVKVTYDEKKKEYVVEVM